MLDFVKKYSGNTYSQNGEDFILKECLLRMQIETGHCVEFGAADGKFCSNTFRLLESGWTGSMFEVDQELFNKLKENIIGVKAIAVHQAITPKNINILLPKSLDVLSIDTDSDNDYNCWKDYTGTAKIVIIEINSSIQPLTEYLYEGASYLTMVQLGISKGYFLLAHTGNLVFIHNDYKDLFPEIDKHPVMDYEFFFNTSWL